jgi:amino-acid N-acetyltransferase
MLVKKAKNQREDIVAILSAEKLPVDDLPEKLDTFLVATDNGQLVGVIGIEVYGAYGLLRSLAVLPDHRNKGIAGKLIDRLESVAKLNDLKEIYLLTETAPEYFAGKAFQKITRDEVPNEVKQSSEFSHVCPVSAIVMKKSIL